MDRTVGIEDYERLDYERIKMTRPKIAETLQKT